MPLLKRKAVPILPLPPQVVDGTVSPDHEVFFLRATGEIFLDYDSYATRTSYLMQRIFQCAISGKRDLDYFAALVSETQTASKTTSRFPEELVGHVLRSCQFQVEGRLDGLIERVNDRFHNRFFKGERVFIEIQGDKYLCRVTQVFPPPSIRSHGTKQEDSASSPTASDGQASVPPSGNADQSAEAHRVGTDLEIPIEEANELDPPGEYLYTVQLQDSENNFEGSFMEAKNNVLSRDRLHYSKSMLKRLLRDSLIRDAQIAKPWVVRSNLCEKYNIPSLPPDNIAEKNEKIRDGKLAKRKKTPKEDDEIAKKRLKKEQVEKERERLRQLRKEEAKKPIKYPIEDLDLDPMSIHDGRVLRRVLTEVPPLPPKPESCRDLPVPKADFEAFLMIWNMINIFGIPLALSNFTLDDFDGALKHDTLDPRCTLLAEIHAALLNIISSENLRIQGTSHTTSTTSHLPLASSSTDEDDKHGDGLSSEMCEYVVRKGLEYSRGWDRGSKLKASDGRDGWDRHLIGCLCQRGGLENIPQLPRILMHLLYGSSPPAIPTLQNGDAAEKEITSKPDGSTSPPPTDHSEAYENDVNIQEDPEHQYLTLSLSDKLLILGFLTELVLGSKHVRGYIEECEAELTDLRKERVELNKEKKLLLSEKQALTEKNKPKEEKGENGNDLNGTKEGEEPTTENGMKTEDATPAPADAGSNGDPDDNESMQMDSIVPGQSPETRTDELNGDDDDQVADDGIDAFDQEGKDDEDDEGEDDEDDEEADSEVDELESNGGGGSGEDSVPALLNPASRKATLEEKRRRREAEAAERARAREARDADKAEDASKQRIAENEEELKKLNKKSDELEREFRKYRDVARVRPLGKDRFYNRFFYFDGVGSMPIVAQGGHPMYWTGRLYIQGPNKEDYELMVSERSGADEIHNRRIREEGESSLLEPGEWGYLDTEEQIDTLLNWLNAKGNREMVLKASLRMWKNFIVAGAKKRKADFELQASSAPMADSRRSTRAAAINSHYFARRYMSYHNRFARQ